MLRSIIHPTKYYNNNNNNKILCFSVNTARKIFHPKKKLLLFSCHMENITINYNFHSLPLLLFILSVCMCLHIKILTVSLRVKHIQCHLVLFILHKINYLSLKFLAPQQIIITTHTRTNTQSTVYK